MLLQPRQEGEECAETAPDERQGQQLVGLTVGHYSHCDDRDPLAQFLLAEQGQRMPDRAHFYAEAEACGIEVPKKPVRERGFLLDPLGERPHIVFGLIRCLQKLEVGQPEGRDFFVRKHLRPAEVETLKQGIPHLDRLSSFLLGFHFLREHADAARAKTQGQRALLLMRGQAEVNLDEIGEGDDRVPHGGAGEIIEGEQVPVFLQAAAGVDDLGIRSNVFQEFHDGEVTREQRNIVGEQELPGAVDKGAAPLRQLLKSEQKRSISHRSGCRFEVDALAGVFNAAAEQQFVGEDILTLVEDGLTG